MRTDVPTIDVPLHQLWNIYAIMSIFTQIIITFLSTGHNSVNITAKKKHSSSVQKVCYKLLIYISLWNNITDVKVRLAQSISNSNLHRTIITRSDIYTPSLFDQMGFEHQSGYA